MVKIDSVALVMRHALLNVCETARHAGRRHHRRATAVRKDIRPEGNGRQGLLTLSSSGSRVWLETLNWNKWSHSQNRPYAACFTDAAGAAPMPNAICRPFSWILEPRYWSCTHCRDNGCDDVRPCKEIDRPEIVEAFRGCLPCFDERHAKSRAGRVVQDEGKNSRVDLDISSFKYTRCKIKCDVGRCGVGLPDQSCRGTVWEVWIRVGWCQRKVVVDSIFIGCPVDSKYT